LIPNRDLGVQVSGDLFDGRLSYAAALLNGTADNTSANNTDIEGKKEAAARLFTHPFAGSSHDWIRGLGFGVGGSYGTAENAGNLPNGGKGTYVTDSQQTWFTYKSTVAGDTTGAVTDGTHWRGTPQGYSYYGPFGLLGEYVISDQRYRAGNGTAAVPFKFATLDNTAWQVAVSYVLTGEDASYKGVSPRHNLSLTDHTWGALELVARYSELDIDRAAFNGFADPAKSARDAHEVVVGLNWYPNRIFRASVNYTLTDYDGGNGATGNKHSENVILTRFQVAF
jgi:phosphate-selective porin OprO/OprP